MTEKKSKPFPPNKVLDDFAPLIGIWCTQGSHGMIKSTVLHGSAAYEWHESKAFILVRTTIQEDVGIPNGVAIIGSDDAEGKYVMVYYDERGVSRHYQMSIEDKVLKWWRDDPKLAQRSTLTISNDGQTMIGKGEISLNGSDWEQDLNLTYRRDAT